MKDAFWFKHDSNAIRDSKLMMLKHIYDFWGIGLYWTVIEFLREQDKYKFNSDEKSLDLVCSLVMCLDTIRFNNWFKDCIRFGLFKIENGCFFSQSLIDRMKNWEVQKANGSKGGRPKKPEKKPRVKPEDKPEAYPLDILDIKDKEYNIFIMEFNSITGKNFKGTKKDRGQFNARMKEGYTQSDFEKAIKNCKTDSFHIENPNYLTPEFITRADKLQKYLNSKIDNEPERHKSLGETTRGLIPNPDFVDERLGFR